jgi:class 3 adenylate cyclase
VNGKPKITFFQTAAGLLRILHGVMIGIVLLYLVPFLVMVSDNADQYGYVRSALAAEQTLSALVRDSVPTHYGGRDLTRLIVIVGSLFIGGLFGRAADKLRNTMQFLSYKNNLDDWKSQMNISDNAIVLSPLNRTLDELRNAKRKDRERLMREYAEAKKQLDAMGRDLAFLSVDVVDSAGMKLGEEAAIVEHDFREYKRFVDRIFATHGSLRSAWTPDGVMSCFTSVDAAVRAAREILTGLDRFNREVKSIRRIFSVRCGVNSGFVYYDGSVPLEEISDRVIDIAGHMQKQAKPNTVCVAKPAIEPLGDRIGFEPSGRVVDGYEVYEWTNP